ncbi:MAG: MerR family transcriptional regulator, repressor of the yfmOP operon [Solirubrobacteraceae bacterium]|nr:MerR family transcriptional regulator, repressor of the yfmOP operon [Solirubrobacteraceae bacterium]
MPGAPKPASSAQDQLRIGDLAKLAGTTPRTIRYYEEVGLLPETVERVSGAHRTYSHAELERLQEVMRLKELLGLTLEELKALIAVEEARAEVRAQLRREDVAPARRRELLVEARGHLDRQLELVRHRAAELSRLQDELSETRKRVRRKIRELDAQSEGSFPPQPPLPAAVEGSS